MDVPYQEIVNVIPLTTACCKMIYHMSHDCSVIYFNSYITNSYLIVHTKFSGSGLSFSMKMQCSLLKAYGISYLFLHDLDLTQRNSSEND